MPETLGKCDLCKKGNYILTETKTVGGTEYKVLKCDKCFHQIARGTS